MGCSVVTASTLSPKRDNRHCWLRTGSPFRALGLEFGPSAPLNVTFVVGGTFFFSILSIQPLVTPFLLQASIDGIIYKYKVFIAPGESAGQLSTELTEKLSGKKDESPRKQPQRH